MKALPEAAADIRKGIDTKTIGSSHLRPPGGVLGQVPRNRRILLIHVGQNVGKPSLGDILLVAPGGMRIIQRLEVALGHAVRGSVAMEPVRLGGVLNPWV